MIDIISRLSLSTHLLQYPERDCDARFRKCLCWERPCCFSKSQSFLSRCPANHRSRCLSLFPISTVGWGQSLAEFAEVMATRTLIGNGCTQNSRPDRFTTLNGIVHAWQVLVVLWIQILYRVLARYNDVTRLINMTECSNIEKCLVQIWDEVHVTTACSSRPECSVI